MPVSKNMIGRSLGAVRKVRIFADRSYEKSVIYWK